MGSVPFFEPCGFDSSISVRYLFAEFRSPDLMADSSSERVLLKVSVVEALPLVLVELVSAVELEVRKSSLR